MLAKAIRRNYKWIVLLICSVIFIAILEDIYEKEQLEIDIEIYKAVVLNLRVEWLTGIMKFVTNIGGAYVLVLIAICSIIFIKDRKIGISITSNLIVVTILNIILKNIIERPRPEGYRLIAETGYSFPSGHSMVSMAFYGFIIFLIWKKVNNVKLKYISTILLTLLIPLIGFSRIYLGVHYASDVLGGFAIAIIYLIAFTSIIRNYLGIKENVMITRKKVELIKKRKKLRNSFKYAFTGILTALKKEQNMKIHFIIMLIVIIAGIIFKLNQIEWLICIILFGLVISFELMNTAIEQTVDIAMPEKNEKAKIAKDVAAGAVLVVAMISVICGLIIFIPKIIA